MSVLKDASSAGFHYGARNHAEVHNLYRKSLRLIAVVDSAYRRITHMYVCAAHKFLLFDISQ